jgi:hypothetical protein
MNNDKWLNGVIYSDNLSKKDIEIKKLKERISKAIEYIENYIYFDEDGCSYNSDVDEVRVLKILKGEDNE